MYSGEEASHTKLHDLYEKYNVREKEISRLVRRSIGNCSGNEADCRLEKQNEEYREKLIRAIRERDEFEEKVKLDTKERTAKVEELDRKVVELDCTLKVAKVSLSITLIPYLFDKNSSNLRFRIERMRKSFISIEQPQLSLRNSTSKSMM